jgi:hypothetical protein
VVSGLAAPSTFRRYSLHRTLPLSQDFCWWPIADPNGRYLCCNPDLSYLLVIICWPRPCSHAVLHLPLLPR